MRKSEDRPESSPLIAYCALHQSNDSCTRDEYVATMVEFHQRIHDESLRLVRNRLRSLEETENRELKRLDNSLAAFLQTPLKADKEEIQREIGSSLRKIREASFTRENPGITRSTEGEVVQLPHGQPPVRKMSLNGNRYLADLGFDTAKKRSGVFESAFIIRGGENLDVLEHIVRDVLGIYATTHGKHLREFGNYSYCLYNIVHDDYTDHGTMPDRVLEAALFFRKPGPEKIKYAPFRNDLLSLMESLKTDLHLSNIALWQRKLGLGTGVEFVLRMNMSDERSVEEIATWLHEYSGNNTIHRALSVDGRLMLKKMLFMRSANANSG